MTDPAATGGFAPYPPATGTDRPPVGTGVPGTPTDGPVGVSSPPPGPGVVPPFAAPPVEGRTLRMWISIGVAALAVLVFCGGGSAALLGLVISGTEAINEQSRAVVSDYFDAVSRREYSRAYGLLCAQVQQRESPPEFVRRVTAEPPVAGYRVGEAVIGRTEISVPVDVTYAGGGQAKLRAAVVQENQTGTLRICEIG